MRGWWDLWGHMCVGYLCGVWEPGKITPLLLCICIVFVLYFYFHVDLYLYFYCICGDIGVGYLRGSVGVGTINAPAASPQIPILPSPPPPPSSSLPNYLLNCPQHRRLATQATDPA